MCVYMYVYIYEDMKERIRGDFLHMCMYVYGKAHERIGGALFL
jgi:hypothetical protein